MDYMDKKSSGKLLFKPVGFWTRCFRYTPTKYTNLEKKIIWLLFEA